MIVADASAFATMLTDDGPDGVSARERLAAEAVVAPGVIDLEVVSALRRGVRTGRFDERRAGQALADLTAFPLRRMSHVPLLPRIWELRENATAYDASYLALAEAVAAPLVTADAKLHGVPDVSCEIELLD